MTAVEDVASVQVAARTAVNHAAADGAERESAAGAPLRSTVASVEVAARTAVNQPAGAGNLEQIAND